jgi:hypothetical protein
MQHSSPSLQLPDSVSSRQRELQSVHIPVARVAVVPVQSGVDFDGHFSSGLNLQSITRRPPHWPHVADEPGFRPASA